MTQIHFKKSCLVNKSENSRILIVQTGQLLVADSGGDFSADQLQIKRKNGEVRLLSIAMQIVSLCECTATPEKKKTRVVALIVAAPSVRLFIT